MGTWKFPAPPPDATECEIRLADDSTRRRARPRLRNGMTLPPPSVLVLDGEQRAALAVVRSLGRHGCTVHVGSHVTRSLSGGSRFTSSEFLLPDPLGSSETYCLAVRDLATRCSASVIVPIVEASTLALLEGKALLGGLVVPCGDFSHFRRASDKAAVHGEAEALGIKVPTQWIAAPGAEVPNLPRERFPVVIKPSRSVSAEDGTRRKTTGVTYADTPGELARLLAAARVEEGPLLIQSRVTGVGLGLFLLRWNGEVVAHFAHRRLREKPPSGGVSVCCESIRAPKELLAQSIALLEALDWTGVAMVEFKYDERTGQAHLMEINPRFWGSLQLAVDAGVDFPWYVVQLALGKRIPHVAQWRIGVRSRWGWGDIDHLIARLRHTREQLHLPPDAPSVISTALSVLLPWRPWQRGAVFRFSDPVPSLRESIAWFRAL